MQYSNRISYSHQIKKERYLVQQHTYAASTENGLLQLEQFKEHPSAKTDIAKLFFSLLEEKEWSSDISAAVCFNRNGDFIALHSEKLFGFHSHIKFEIAAETPGTVESVRYFIFNAVMNNRSAAMRREEQAKEEQIAPGAMMQKIYRYEAHQFLKAKALGDRVYKPRYQVNCFRIGIYYAVNGNGLLVARDSDVDCAKSAYFLKNTTREQFEKERLNLTFRHMVKGAKKL